MASTIAAQLYTLREFTKTPADIAKTFKRLRQIGYQAVQCSALGPIEPKELANLLQGEGLACAATHVGTDELKDVQKVLDKHKLIGCNYTAIGGFFPKETLTAELWEGFARDYNEIGKKYEGTSLAIGYHNHSHELSHAGNKPALQLLIDKLSKPIWFEIDTYWITHGGGDPAAWIGKVAGRIPCVHLKDMVIGPDRQQRMAEVGEGNLNWPGILKACKEAGVKWYIVEQDTCYRDPFDCLETSLKNLQAMGIQ